MNNLFIYLFRNKIKPSFSLPNRSPATWTSPSPPPRPRPRPRLRSALLRRGDPHRHLRRSIKSAKLGGILSSLFPSIFPDVVTPLAKRFSHLLPSSPTPPPPLPPHSPTMPQSSSVPEHPFLSHLVALLSIYDLEPNPKASAGTPAIPLPRYEGPRDLQTDAIERSLAKIAHRMRLCRRKTRCRSSLDTPPRL
jgi:hypothetical protein